MDWSDNGGQEETIQDFNSGRTNLLVSTSVLEEGIDLTTCEMVFVFSMSLNLIRFVFNGPSDFELIKVKGYHSQNQFYVALLI